MGPLADKQGKEPGGFSLLEVLFVLLIVGVLATIAAPHYFGYIAKTRLAGHGQLVLETLRLARLEAVTREIPVSVCASTNGMLCTGTPWEEGWLVFVDEGLPGIIDGNDMVLRSVPAYAGGVTLDVTITKGTVDYFQFEPAKVKMVNVDRLPPVVERYGYLQLASEIAGNTVLAMLGVQDAFAKKGKKDRRRAVYKQICTKPGSENSPHCKEPIAVLELCSDKYTKETGTAVRTISDGDAVIEEIDCE